MCCGISCNCRSYIRGNRKIRSFVKYIVKFKQEEIEECLQAKDKKEYNQKLLELIERKQNEELAGKSIEELQAMLKA